MLQLKRRSAVRQNEKEKNKVIMSPEEVEDG